MLNAETRVVVIPIAIDAYDTPQGEAASTSSAFDSLPLISHDLMLLRALVASAPYRAARFEMLAPIGGRADEIVRELKALKPTLKQRPELTVLMFWSGHGQTVGSDLRLVTSECFAPLDASDGLGPADVIGPLADALPRALLVLLDVCQAGAASVELLAAAAKRAMLLPPEHGFAFGALLSAYAYEPARDGLFVSLLERVLREGPSQAAQARMANEQWEAFSPKNRMLSLSDVQQVLAVEVELLKATRPGVQTPLDVQQNSSSHRPFPNPRYDPRSAPRNAEQVHRRLLQADAETHFLPKARGLEPGEDGWFFSGRAAVTRELVQWLRGEAGSTADQDLFVLTGEGGSGKSAIIGRLVMLSDGAWRENARAMGWNEVADRAAGTLPEAGAVDAALHLRRRTVDQAATDLSALLGLSATSLAGFIAEVDAWPAPGLRKPNIVLDALDEADEPATIVTRLLRPLRAAGWHLLVATRRRAAHVGAPDLVALLGPAHVRDLDAEADSGHDIARYVQRRLEQSAAPYSAADAAAIGQAVADRAVGRFLYARIAIGGLLRRTGPPLAAARITEWLAVDLYHALQGELAALDDAFRLAFSRADAGAAALLSALAWSEGEGLPLRDALWPAVASAIGEAPLDATHAAWLLREGGRFIVESGDGEQAVYRLYHQSLVDHFRAATNAPDMAERIAAALQSQRVEHGAWTQANPYLVNHLATHLAAVADEAPLRQLLLDVAWNMARLNSADIAALLLDHERCAEPTPALRAVAQALRRSAHALASDARQLAPQLLARLLGDSTAGVAPLLDALVEQQTRQRRTWLRPTVASMAGERAIRSMRADGDGSLDAVAFSRKGRWAVHNAAGGVALFDLQRWKPCGVIFTPPSTAFALAVSDDGRTVLVADSIGGVYCWREGEERLRGGPAHDDRSIALLLALSADGRYGLSAAYGPKRGLIAWDFEADTHEVLGHRPPDTLSALYLDATGTLAWLGHADGSVLRVQLRPFRVLDRFAVSGRPLALAQTPDQIRVAVGASDLMVEVRHFDIARQIRWVLSEQPRCVALSNSGTLLAVGTEHGTVEVWDIKHGQRCASYTGAHTYEVRQIAFTHDDSELTSADIIHAKRWNSRAPDEAASEWRVVSDLAGTATGSGGSAAFAVLSDGRLGQWLLSAGREFRPLPATGTQLSAWKGVAVAAEAWRAFAWGDTGLAVWDLSKERPLGSIAASDVKAAAISADGRCIVRAEGSQVIGWWPDSGRTQIIGRYGSGETPRALAITPDGRRVISCAFDRSAKVWALDPDADEPSQLAYRYISTREKPNSVHCLSDHAAVITTGSGELLLFDPQDDSPSGVQLLDGRHEAFVSTLLPFGDGMRFATSSGDRSIRLWDLFSGECTNVFRQHPGHLQQLSLATGRMLATTFAGELKVLSLEDGSLIAAFQADKQIISAVADSDLRSITAVDQGGGLHFLRLETP